MERNKEGLGGWSAEVERNKEGLGGLSAEVERNKGKWKNLGFKRFKIEIWEKVRKS